MLCGVYDTRFLIVGTVLYLKLVCSGRKLLSTVCDKQMSSRGWESSKVYTTGLVSMVTLPVLYGVWCCVVAMESVVLC